MLFNIPFMLTGRNTARENDSRIDYDYKVGQTCME